LASTGDTTGDTTGPSVERSPLGTTGLEVSRLSLGGSALGGDYGDTSDDQAVATVRFAIDRGLNLIDTSPYYGQTRSEHRIGEALTDGFRERVVLATKAGRYRDGSTSRFDYSHDGIMRSWEESAERLQTSYFDVYQLHDVEFVREDQILTEAWPAMVRLREEGKVGHIGITGYPVRHLAHLARALDPAPETILTYCHHNLLNTTFDDALLTTVRELGIGVINGSVTHMGVLTEQGAADWHPAPPAVHETGRRVVEMVRDRGYRITDVALQFALAHPAIASTCVGMRSVEEVEQNIAAIGGSVDRTLLADIDSLVAPIKNLNWSQGHEEYADPGSVPSRP
jgi:L-galactose dehydrogenase